MFTSKIQEVTNGGEMGIRTPETILVAYTISSRAPSASRTPLLKVTKTNKLRVLYTTFQKNANATYS